MVTSIMHLILFTGLLQVTLATVDAGNGSALKSVSNADGNVGLVSLGNMNLALEKLGYSCEGGDQVEKCTSEAQKTAHISGKFNQKGLTPNVQS